MLANLRRKVGMSTGAPPTPVPGMHNGGPNGPEPMVLSSQFVEQGPGGVPGGVPPPPPFTMEELGLPWPGNPVANFSPSDIPVWLQEQVRRFPHPPLRSPPYVLMGPSYRCVRRTSLIWDFR